MKVKLHENLSKLLVTLNLEFLLKKSYNLLRLKLREF